MSRWMIKVFMAVYAPRAAGFFFRRRPFFSGNGLFFQETTFFFGSLLFFLQPLWSHLNLTLLEIDQSKVHYCVEYIKIDAVVHGKKKCQVPSVSFMVAWSDSFSVLNSGFAVCLTLNKYTGKAFFSGDGLFFQGTAFFSGDSLFF